MNPCPARESVLQCMTVVQERGARVWCTRGSGGGGHGAIPGGTPWYWSGCISLPGFTVSSSGVIEWCQKVSFLEWFLRKVSKVPY